jgi:hypothetical protein
MLFTLHSYLFWQETKRNSHAEQSLHQSYKSLGWKARCLPTKLSVYCDVPFSLSLIVIFEAHFLHPYPSLRRLILCHRPFLQYALLLSLPHPSPTSSSLMRHQCDRNILLLLSIFTFKKRLSSELEIMTKGREKSSCKVWGFHSVVDEECSLLAYAAVWFDN